MGMRGSATCELSFDNIHLRQTRCSAHRAWASRWRCRPWTRAHQYRRHSRRPRGTRHDNSQELRKRARAFGKPIGKFEGVQFKFADMSAEIRAMELMTYDTARMKAEGKRHTLEAAQTKLFSATRCTQICLECQQVLGGNGYSKEYHVERFVRDAKLLEIGEGTNEILRMLIGGTILAQK